MMSPPGYPAWLAPWLPAETALRLTDKGHGSSALYSEHSAKVLVCSDRRSCVSIFLYLHNRQAETPGGNTWQRWAISYRRVHAFVIRQISRMDSPDERTRAGHINGETDGERQSPSTISRAPIEYHGD